MYFTIESLSPFAADKVIERVESSREEQRKAYHRQFEYPGVEPDLQVQEEVSSTNYVISNSTKTYDFLKLVKLCSKI